MTALHADLEGTVIAWRRGSRNVKAPSVRSVATNGQRSTLTRRTRCARWSSRYERARNARSRTVSKPASADAADQFNHAFRVGELARAVPEIKLREVAREVLTADVVMCPVERTLQLREEVFDLVRGDLAVQAGVFADAVRQVPGRPVGDAVLPFDLPGRDTVLARGHLKEDEHPRPDRDLRAVHDGPSEDRELHAARGALPRPALCRRARARRAGGF